MTDRCGGCIVELRVPDFRISGTSFGMKSSKRFTLTRADTKK